MKLIREYAKLEELDRPTLLRLIKRIEVEAEAGNIGTIIVKDMSRFGRNYLQVGFYKDLFLGQYGGDCP